MRARVKWAEVSIAIGVEHTFESSTETATMPTPNERSRDPHAVLSVLPEEPEALGSIAR